MTLIDRIVANLPRLRREKGFTQDQLADKADIGRRQYQRIESTGKTSMGTLEKIATALDIPSSSITELTEEENRLSKIGTLLDINKFRAIPIVNSIPASGFTRSYDDMLVEDFTLTNLTQLGLIALRVKGDSMAPKIENGDLAIVAPDMPYENNSIYAVIAGDSEASLKTVKRVDGGFWCIPMNTAYNAIFVPEQQMIRLYKLVQVIKNNL
jgi:repressor LexA